MDTITLAAVCLKRWYVLVPVILAGLVAAMALGKAPTTTYYGNANFTLVARGSDAATAAPRPSSSASPAVENPLIVNGAGLLVTALNADMNTQDARKAVGAAGGSAAFSVARVRDTTVVRVDASGSDSAAVAKTVAAVLKVTDQRIRALQTRAGAPAETQLKVFALGAIDPPFALKSSDKRFRIAVIGFGVVLGVVLALLFDALMALRARRRRERGLPVREQHSERRSDLLSGTDQIAKEEREPAPWLGRT